MFLGVVNPPITNSAISGMPRSMAGLADSLASTGGQAGTALGVAIAGTLIGPAQARGGTAFTGAAHAVWWMILALGAGIVILGLISTGRWAARYPPSWIKLCRFKNTIPRTDELVRGMYLMRAYFELLKEDSNTPRRGPHGGIR